MNPDRRVALRWAGVCLTMLGALLALSVHAQGQTLSETFEDPALPGWERSGNAEVVDGTLRIGSDGFALHSGDWGDLSLIVKANLNGAGAIVISYRVSEVGDYAVHISRMEISLHKAGARIAQETIEPIPPEEWFLVEVLADGESHEIRLYGQPVLAASDPDPLPPGGVALAVQGEALGQFDDLLVESLGAAPPPEEPDQEETPPAEGAPPEEGDEIPSTTDLTWVRTGGPPGGIGYDIRYKFDDHNIWYVTDNFAGVHMSTDNGLTWQPSNAGIPGQLGPTSDWRPIFSLTVDPHNPQIIWAGTDKTGNIYKSTDGGLTWTQRDNGVIKRTSEFDALTFRGFTVDPNSSEVVYAMGETLDTPVGRTPVWGTFIGGVVYKTTNGGEQWELIWDGGIPSSLARYMWINPENTDILYVSTGIFDRGAVNEGDPETDAFPYGGLGILKSTDGGDSWRVLNEANGLNFYYISSLFMHPEDPDILLAAAGKEDTDLYLNYLEENSLKTAMGVYRTSDGGESWTQVLDVGGFNAVEMCPSDPNIVYAGSIAVVYRSEDAGVTWTQVAGQGGNGWGPPGILAGTPIDMQCDPRDPNRVFTNNYVGGNFLSTDGGKTWSNASDGYTGAQIARVHVDPQNPAQIYVAGRSGIWSSSNAGGSWSGMRYPEPGVIVYGGEWGGIAIDPSDSQHLLASEETIWESFDGGSSWEVRRSPAYAMAAALVFAPSDPSIVYTGSADTAVCVIGAEGPCLRGNGVHVSRDGGTTWEFANDANMASQPLIDLAVDPLDPDVVYAATQGGLYKTLNGGTNWTAIDGLPHETRVSAITIHPQDAQQLMAGVEGHGLYTSADGGQTWGQIAAGLQPNNAIRDILYDPSNPQTVYLSDLMSGVYRSTDGGQTWTQIINGLTTRSTTGLAASSDGQHIYVATNGEGVFRLDLNGQAPVSQASAPSGEQASTEEELEGEPEGQRVEEPPTTPAEEEAISGLPSLLIGVVIGIVLALVGGGAVVLILRRRRTT